MVWLAVIFFLSHQPEDALPPLETFIPDWASHIVLYGVLGVALAWGRRQSGGRPSWAVLGVLGMVWAVSDEWHQTFIPGRFASAADVAADAVGLLGGAVAATLVMRALLPTSSSRRPRTPAQPMDRTS